MKKFSIKKLQNNCLILGEIAEDMPISTRWKPACHNVAKKIVQRSLELRTKLVGELLKVVRSISQHTFSEETFEEGSHTVSSEPYSYKSPVLKEVTVIDWKNNCLVTKSRLSNDEHEYLLDEIPIAVDIDGRCHLSMDDEKQIKSWKCNATCKTLSRVDRQIIVDFKNNFSDNCMEDVRDVSDSLDDNCQNSHYYKFFDRLVDTEENSDVVFNLEPLKKKKPPPTLCI